MIYNTTSTICRNNSKIIAIQPFTIFLTYYFMLYMMERFNYLMRKQYEDEMYREEMFYK